MKLTYRLTFIPIMIILLSMMKPVMGQSLSQTDSLQNLAKHTAAQYMQNKEEALKWAQQNKQPVRFNRGKNVYELQYIDQHGKPQYYKTDNAVASITISTNKLYPSGGLGLSLTGTGMVVREWDGGNVLSTHQEFGTRVSNIDGTNYNDHATHVAGTILAAGVVPAARGMAYAASLRSFDWNSDISEMASEGAAGALVSNHSYGFVRGWADSVWYGDTEISTLEDYLFGFYDYYSRQWDLVANNAPYYLIVKSAGNDRGDSGIGHPADGDYDCIGQQGVSKNILTVGAVNDIPGGYTAPADVVMSSFSSWGPADDGRIKPDIVTNGVLLYSSIATGNTNYAYYSGTSMASPSATGSLALLQQHYNNLNGTYMLSSTLKALVIHTADEAGPNNGPDYMFGWGLMNTARAANRITEDVTTNVISEHLLTNGSSFTRQVVALGTEPLKVTIVWNDPAGTPPAASLDPITPMLVNDLDLRLTYSSSTSYPWKLDRDNPGNAATNTSENNVDNVEIVYIASPIAGATYTITVDHDGSLSGGSQSFSMVLSGIESSVAPIANFLASPTSPTTEDIVQFTDLSTNSPTSWLWSITPATYTYMNGTDASSQNPQILFTATGNYTISLTATNSHGSDIQTKINYISVSGCGAVPLPYSQGFESGEMPPACWTSLDQDGDSYGWKISNSHTPAEGTYAAYSESYINDIGPLTPDNWLISPGFTCTTDSLVLTYSIKAQDSNWLSEKYSVLLSTTGNSIGDFTPVYTSTISTSGWYTVSISFLGFAGEQVYLAFRHWDCTDQYQILLDNIRIEEFGLPVDLFLSNISLASGQQGCYNASHSITAAGNGKTVLFQSGSSAKLNAGALISLLPGFHAFEGSSVKMTLTDNPSLCNATSSIYVSTCFEKSASDHDRPSKKESAALVLEQTNYAKQLVRIYPNPNRGKFRIELQNFTGNTTVSVINFAGAVLYHSLMTNSGSQEIDLPGASQGLYFIRLKNQETTRIEKILIR